MPDVTTGFRECRDRVRALGYRVEEVPGWESRGKGRASPTRALNHHDAIRGPSPVAGLRLCTFGREGLRNALCNTYGERGPGAGIWLVAAGVAWHAGTGSWRGVSGNSRAFGRENANDGVGEPWHPDALEVQRVWDRVQSDVFAIPPAMYCEHREWTPRKPDRRGIDGAAWRAALATNEEDDDLQDDERRMLMELIPARLDKLEAAGIDGSGVSLMERVRQVLRLARGPAGDSVREVYERAGLPIATGDEEAAERVARHVNEIETNRRPGGGARDWHELDETLRKHAEHAED